MQVRLKRVNDGVLMRAENDAGNTILIDGDESVGGVGGGFRPMQLLLAGIAGCSVIDLIGILVKQRQRIDDLEIVVDGTRAEGVVPAPFTDIHLHYILTGRLDRPRVERALYLAVEKYCSVGAMLGKSATVGYDYEIRDVEV